MLDTRVIAERQRGFTLVELLVTLAVAAILLVVAAPNLGDLLRQNEASTMLNDYVYALRLARSEAVTESVPVSVCQSGDAASCSGEGDWEAGWLVFRDPNDDGDCQGGGDGVCDDGGRVVHVHRPDASDFRFRATGVASGGSLTYAPSGHAEMQMGTFSLCDQRESADARGIVLNSAGRVRLADSDDIDCS